MSFTTTIILAKQFIVCTKINVHKKYQQKVATKSVYNMSPHNISTKGVVKKCPVSPDSAYEKCPWQGPKSGD